MKKTKLAIIGSGPAGVSFYDAMLSLSSYTKSEMQLIDPSGTVCSSLAGYGVFVENIHSICPSELRFLVDSKITGPELQNYFKKRYDFPVIKSKVLEIIKAGNGMFTIVFDAGFIVAEQVVLATGVTQKLLPLTVFDQNREIYDFTFKKFSSFQQINYIQSEVIFIGSGDNCLFKAGRLAEWIEKNNIPHKENCIKIFVKENFKVDCNPTFLEKVNNYVKKSFIEIHTNNWDIVTIESNSVGLVSTIYSNTSIYKSDFSHGAYISVYTGNIIKTPKLTNCLLCDLHTVGDVDLFSSGKICTIYDAIENARNAAVVFPHKP